MKLKWFGSGTGAGLYVDLYEVEGGREIVVGAYREEDKPSRADVIRAFASIGAEPKPGDGTRTTDDPLRVSPS